MQTRDRPQDEGSALDDLRKKHEKELADHDRDWSKKYNDMLQVTLVSRGLPSALNPWPASGHSGWHPVEAAHERIFGSHGMNPGVRDIWKGERRCA